MGQVYLGRSARGDLAAVKTIRSELAGEAAFHERFAQEVAAAQRVNGAFTPLVVDADPAADVPWLATAYVPAPSLSRLVYSCGPLPPRTVNWLAAGCAAALESIHGAGLVHRDLKPSNVLVAHDGPRVIDFGVAWTPDRAKGMAGRGAVGTPAYRAPEQASDSHWASVAGDVYSLGATLLFAATGHPPYAGETVADVMMKLGAEAPDLTGLPDELSELITACLQRIPHERPTPSEVLARVEQVGEVQTVFARERSCLPEGAMALVAEYQRYPHFVGHSPAGQEHGDDQPTSAGGIGLSGL